MVFFSLLIARFHEVGGSGWRLFESIVIGSNLTKDRLGIRPHRCLLVEDQRYFAPLSQVHATNNCRVWLSLIFSSRPGFLSVSFVKKIHESIPLWPETGPGAVPFTLEEAKVFPSTKSRDALFRVLYQMGFGYNSPRNVSIVRRIQEHNIKHETGRFN